MSYDGPERRGIRSENSDVALQIFVDRARVRMGVEHLVLAKADGEPIVWSGEGMDPDACGAAARDLFDTGAVFPALRVADDHFAWRINLGAEWGLAYATGRSFVIGPQLRAAADGIARITGYAA